MKKTVLITGASSGIGKGTAKLFQENGWQVAATMRSPEKETELKQLDNLEVIKMDVTKTDGIEKAVDDTIKAFGSIDVLVNNAGFGAFGPFEPASDELIEKQFQTNVMGVMRVTRAVLPQMRKQKEGTIINITSIGGLVTMPLNSVYHGTKFAVDGFTEALNYELGSLGIRTKIVAPGGVETDFAGRSLSLTMNEDNAIMDYMPIIDQVRKSFESRHGNYSTPKQIAEVIYEAATDGTNQLRYLAGEDAKAFYALRKEVDQEEFYNKVNERFGL